MVPRPTHALRLERAIGDRTARVGVIGLGYVGLPLVELFASRGFTVLGLDIDSAKVARLQAGQSYIGHIASERVSALRDGGRFEATADFSRLVEVDAILICVPTPLGMHREPDLSAVIATGRTIGQYLRPGQLVVLESTTYPGTTRDVLRPELEAGGLRAGHDFFLAYSPEREDPGNPKFSAGTIPKVIGGWDEMSGKLTQQLYGAVVPQVVPVSSCDVAEACKILENTYRAVNIALVNELKVVFDRMGIDIWEVIDAAKTKPFGFQAFYPGPGLGGHCIPIDPFYLTWAARAYGLHTRFIELAGEINSAIPHHIIDRIMVVLNDRGRSLCGSRVLVLGAAYKPNVDDCRESPAFELMEMLQDRGAAVSYSDPYVSVLPPLRGHTIQLKSTPLTAETLAAQDCVLIATDHSLFDWEFILRHSHLVVDTRGATRRVPRESGPTVIMA
ncbi:MAG TPA: nucleotide sugar dehydrogenase [Isosphaeraceae bacterium]|nr:nucleotide sugar dehydrogenase [Isosphaeraceae bacterium]